MLDLPDITRREELRQAAGLRRVAPEALDLAGGVAGRGSPGSYVNHAIGLGFAGEFTPRDADTLVEWFTAKGIEPRVELAPAAHESVARELAERRFVLRGFENVFCRPLALSQTIAPPRPAPTGLVIERVDPADDAAARAFAITSITGFLPPGGQPLEGDLDAILKSLTLPEFTALAATLDGRTVATAAMSIRDGVAALFGASVLPEFRRRGVQQALLAARLAHAAAAGATLATIGSRPGVATERNVRRLGFELAYTKVVLAQPGPGLAPVAN